MNNIFEWLVNWFNSNCDGDWEHENGIKIYTVSNPGWFISIGLRDTPLEDKIIESELIEKSDDDWYFYGIKSAKFEASGDTNKLIFLLTKFKELVEAAATERL
ncbi:immunity 53 family protein [Chitinophaga sp. CF418]|uniref:immunity 53 family protein n=1 Tax=Chitinophaga sp. CF418 TaxID=1855287 RepID=UPI000914E7EC|nr:immunity 53 family protein [Chitinophaga sp. CF418]SHN46155.1 Immunity protein 53 [Chitinophaga sp. CF418]